MISNQIHFWVAERPDTFKKSGKEWVLNAQFVGHDSWTLCVWEKKPTDRQVDEIKMVVIRSFEFYHRHLRIPQFKMDVVDL